MRAGLEPAVSSAAGRTRKPFSRAESEISRSAKAAGIDGGMYHILAAQRQAQFGAGQPIDCFDTQPARGGRSGELLAPVRRPVLGLDQKPRRELVVQRGAHIVEAEHKRAGAPRQTRDRPACVLDQPHFHPGGEIGRDLDRGLRRLGEIVLGDGARQNGAVAP